MDAVNPALHSYFYEREHGFLLGHAHCEVRDTGTPLSLLPPSFEYRATLRFALFLLYLIWANAARTGAIMCCYTCFCIAIWSQDAMRHMNKCTYTEAGDRTATFTVTAAPLFPICRHDTLETLHKSVPYRITKFFP